MEVDAALGEERNTALGVGRGVLGQVLELVVLVLVVADVSVTARVSVGSQQSCGKDLPLAGQVQALSAVVPEGHADTRDGVEDLESANGLAGVARVPQTQLAVAHAGEASRGDAVGLAHPHSATILGARVALDLLGGPLLAHIPHAQLLVSARRDELRSVGAPRQRLHNVVVAQSQLGGAGLDVPHLDRVVARGTGQHVLGGGVEQDVADFPMGVSAARH
jgi:hypothetical protein